MVRYSKILLAVMATSVLASPHVSAGTEGDSRTTARIWALEFTAPDLDRAVSFYTTALGFRVERADPEGAFARLTNGKARLLLTRSDAPVAGPGTARTYLNMSVEDLETAVEAAVRSGGTRADAGPEETPVGPYIEVYDPSGNPIHLIDHPWDTKAAGDPPGVFNFGFTVESVDRSEAFFSRLGFEVHTRDYLPDTLVFKRQGIGYFVVHPTAGRAAEPGVSTGSLVAIAGDSSLTREALQAAVPHETSPGRFTKSGGPIHAFRGPSGNWVKLASQDALMEESEAAAMAFDRIKGLEGRWRARSTKGWEENISFEVTARGSVVVETTRFEDAPESTMHTMFYLDGDRLRLTHYCEAGNQPRLEATSIRGGGDLVTFTFLDGGNIPTRNRGHMDKAIFDFSGEDRFSSRWTWYQDGKESWMEEIEFERIR